MELLEGLEASHAARQRLMVILQSLAGVMTVAQAGAVLGINRSRFHVLRQEFLTRAAGLLEPRPPGRHRQQPTLTQVEIQRLRREILELKLDLKATQIREELALIMPHLLHKKRPARAGKKTRRPAMRNATRGGSTGSDKC